MESEIRVLQMQPRNAWRSWKRQRRILHLGLQSECSPTSTLISDTWPPEL